MARTPRHGPSSRYGRSRPPSRSPRGAAPPLAAPSPHTGCAPLPREWRGNPPASSGTRASRALERELRNHPRNRSARSTDNHSCRRLRRRSEASPQAPHLDWRSGSNCPSLDRAPTLPGHPAASCAVERGTRRHRRSAAKRRGQRRCSLATHWEPARRAHQWPSLQHHRPWAGFARFQRARKRGRARRAMPRCHGARRAFAWWQHTLGASLSACNSALSG